MKKYPNAKSEDSTPGNVLSKTSLSTILSLSITFFPLATEL
jgi:hypothetical protein